MGDQQDYLALTNRVFPGERQLDQILSLRNGVECRLRACFAEEHLRRRSPQSSAQKRHQALRSLTLNTLQTGSRWFHIAQDSEACVVLWLKLWRLCNSLPSTDTIITIEEDPVGSSRSFGLSPHRYCSPTFNIALSYSAGSSVFIRVTGICVKKFGFKTDVTSVGLGLLEVTITCSTFFNPSSSSLFANSLRVQLTFLRCSNFADLLICVSSDVNL